MVKHISIVVAALVIGIFMLWSVKTFCSSNNVVSVRGLCEREVKADRAIYPLTFKVAGNDLVVVNNQAKQQIAQLKTFLHNQGFEESEYSVGLLEVTDNYSNSYSSNAPSRYVVKCTVTIYTQKIDNVLAMQQNVSSLLEQGIAISTGESWENPVQYLYEGLNDVKPSMIAEATANARAAAEQFAADSKCRIGKIHNATQGYFTIENRDNNTPYIKKIRVVTNVEFLLK